VRICVAGTGYVGLVSGACLADCGHDVTCVDANNAKIAVLKAGRLPIYEPGLAEITAANIREGRLFFSTDLKAEAARADAILIAVGTPSRPSDGHADLSCVYAVARDIAPVLRIGALIVMKSTVPVGTCDEMERIIAECRCGVDFELASNPEFLRAGAAIHDFKRPDRIIVGGSRATCDRVAELYRPMLADDVPIVCTGRRSAELIKYASNAFLATKIAYINEIADVCERVGADISEVAHGMGLDARIGPQFLSAGPGFGGSCFPKDALALLKMSEDAEAPMRIVESVFIANERRKRAMARKVASAAGTSLLGKTVALLGLAFKPNTDDMREAPSLSMITGLRDMGAHLRAYDPAAGNGIGFPEDVTCCASPYEAARGADVLVIITEWDEFQSLDLSRLKQLMRAPVLVDLRGIYASRAMTRRGFRYFRVGAPAPVPAAAGRGRPSLRLRAGEPDKRANGASRKSKPQSIPVAAARRMATGNGRAV
jgi:UDPglucose 6-dehydrogenase